MRHSQDDIDWLQLVTCRICETLMVLYQLSTCERIPAVVSGGWTYQLDLGNGSSLTARWVLTSNSRDWPFVEVGKIVITLVWMYSHIVASRGILKFTWTQLHSTTQPFVVAVFSKQRFSVSGMLTTPVGNRNDDLWSLSHLSTTSFCSTIINQH